MRRTAYCCCQACSVTTQGEPDQNMICHCTDCKRRTGSGFGWSAYFSEAKVTVSGEWEDYSPKDDPEQTRWRCKNCGSTLWWTISTWPDKIGVAGGAILDPILAAPDGSARHEDRCLWLKYPSKFK